MPTKKIPTTTPLESFRSVFTAVEPPKGGLPTMPTRISELPSDALGDMMCRYSAWREYTEDRHLEACAVYAQVKSEYDNAEDRCLLNATGDTVTERKASARSNPEVQRLAKELTEAEIYQSLLSQKLTSFGNVLAILSRELTRRGVYVSQ